VLALTFMFGSSVLDLGVGVVFSLGVLRVRTGGIIRFGRPLFLLTSIPSSGKLVRRSGNASLAYGASKLTSFEDFD
jgi:hypothetical protein